jgi:hypothetical protein
MNLLSFFLLVDILKFSSLTTYYEVKEPKRKKKKSITIRNERKEGERKVVLEGNKRKRWKSKINRNDNEKGV